MSLKSMVREDVRYSKVSPGLRQLCIQGIDFCDYECTNKVIRNILLKEYYSNPVKRQYMMNEFGDGEVKKIRKSYISFPLLLKVKEVHF